jgi:AraC-like DNA-binding protein
MDVAPSDFRLMRFLSSDYPAQQRLAVWQQILSSRLLKVEIEPVTAQSFHVDASLRVLPDFRFGIGIFAGCISRHTARLASQENDDVYFVENLEGPFSVTSGGMETPLEEGDAIFLSCRQEAVFTRPQTGRLLLARFRRGPMRALVSGLDAQIGCHISKRIEALRLFSSFLRSLDHNQSLQTSELRKLVITHAYDHAALILNAARGESSASVVDDAAANRLGHIKNYITENLERPELSVSSVATAHRLSPRQVQRAFEIENTTFSEFVLTKRLERVRAILADARQTHRAIGEIALSAGFGDVSHFNRAFRRHFGDTPSSVRNLR